MNQLHQTKNTELIEIDEGIRLHITWAQKLFQNLVLKTHTDPQFSAKESHLLCQFGKWFQSNHAKFEKINPDKTRELEQAHYLVHHYLHNIFTKLGENQHVDEDVVREVVPLV